MWEVRPPAGTLMQEAVSNEPDMPLGNGSDDDEEDDDPAFSNILQRVADQER